MKLWRDFCWWLKHAVWGLIDRLIAWRLRRLNED
jgi:CHASE2 domain-containing sensor protein